MRKIRIRFASVLIWGFLALVLAGIVLLAVRKPAREKVAVTETQPVLVRVMTIEPRTVREAVWIPGRVAANVSALLSVEKAGRVVECAVDKGDTVSAGQVLLRVDDRDWRALEKRARLELADAERELARWEQMKASGAVAASEYDAIKQRQELAAVAVDQAAVHVGQCTLASPFDGVVDARLIEAGEYATEGQAAFHVLAELTRLRRAACDPRLVAPELGIVGAKAQEFEQLALELVAGRHKALVFSQFTDFLKLLAERLVAAGISYQYLDGSTPAAERTKRVAAFQAGVGDLFLISLKAGGFGLNLTAADYVLIVDPWWNPAAEDQAMGRAHRIGQLRPVTVYRLVTAGSVEERIVALHQDKRALADGILEGQDQGKPIGAAELRDLLGEG